MSVASLAMYVAPKPVAEATNAFWHLIRDYLRDAGMARVPAELDQVMDYRDAWLHPDLLLSQTCGFPYVKSLRGKVRLVATPCYRHPGCDGPSMRSFVIANRNAGLSSLEDLRGRTAAINSRDSNSGYNLFRAALAPIAGGRPIFGAVVETGGHVASISAVAVGLADCAAIDCVTYGNIARYTPQQLADISILAETPSGPGLPFVTHTFASDNDIKTLQAALRTAIEEPSLAETRDRLGLVDFTLLSDSDYDDLLELERNAAALGYPAIA